MGTFKQIYNSKRHVSESEIREKLIILSYLMTKKNLNENELTEASILDGIKTVFGNVETGLDKIGMKLHHGKGLLDYAKSIAGFSGKMIIAAIKKDKEEILKISKTFEKSEFIDFLLKMDMVTMHIFTGPIHMIDAVTGWDLMANLKAHAHKADTLIDTIGKTIEELKKDLIIFLDASVAEPFVSFLSSISDTLIGAK